MAYTIVFTPEAEEQLVALYQYIAKAASPSIAERYTNSIIEYCEGLETFPERSTIRADIRPGLRITNYRKRTVIAYTIEVETIVILGLFYGGQDFETSLQDNLDS